MRLPRPRFTVRRVMVAVAIVALVLAVPEWLDRWRMNSLADNSLEWARYYEKMAGKEVNSKYRQHYAELQKEMEYYSQHPDESPYFEAWCLWRRTTARSDRVEVGGPPRQSGSN